MDFGAHKTQVEAPYALRLIDSRNKVNMSLLIVPGGSCRYQQTAAMPEKVEVFVDDQKILVDPGTTVLQVL